MRQIILVLISLVFLSACGKEPGSSQQSPGLVPSPPPPPTELNNQGVPACPEHMHEVVSSIWGTKSCVPDDLTSGD